MATNMVHDLDLHLPTPTLKTSMSPLPVN